MKRTDTYILGIDPGLHGGWALLKNGKLIEAGHFPISKETKEIDSGLLYMHWRDLNIDFAFIEDVGVFGGEHKGRKQGVKGMFNFGMRLGQVLGVLQVSDIKYKAIRPSQWKKSAGLSKDKEGVREAAIQLWPSAEHLLTRKKDEARAEAALIARHGFLGGLHNVQ